MSDSNEIKYGNCPGPAYPQMPHKTIMIPNHLSTMMDDIKCDILQEAANHCRRSAAAWESNGFPERALAAESLAVDFTTQALKLKALNGI